MKYLGLLLVATTFIGCSDSPTTTMDPIHSVNETEIAETDQKKLPPKQTIDDTQIIDIDMPPATESSEFLATEEALDPAEMPFEGETVETENDTLFMDQELLEAPKDKPLSK